MSLNNSQANGTSGAQRRNVPSGSRALWAPLALGVLSATIVGSPLAGTALGTALIAGVAALALALLTQAGVDVTFSRSSPGFGMLVGICVIVAALATGSVLGAVFGQTWASWAAALIAFLVVTLGLWIAARLPRTDTPAAL